ncbi:hypothetical protein ceV_094 [Chrysochromulina ericina virus CeV-01B]|jgi:hypothetical protein|uniref:Uncharacterized protein n=1 Tax=Chrysochromulina ericina virus CeV-01B TaxID=3070830 RepID=A0A0N9Q985_9VIRU|nr:hypothetical protein ceV_094 [Chrysochromulina ericina virus]ALH23000.1 hypothetical protein ceV_094 [Chrysochromulina ericina virus CeV-01B]|tara:strand:- start:2193 stop:2513 length:321 start_codon:yes stop_codon:yes gene_type:complete
MRIINTSLPLIYVNNSDIQSISNDDLYILIAITSILFLSFTIRYCSKYIENNCRDIDTINNTIRLRESTIDIDDKISKNFDIHDLDNSNLSDNEQLPTYNEVVKNY